MSTSDEERSAAMSKRDSAAVTKRQVIVAGHVGDVDRIRPHLLDDDPGVRSAALSAMARADALDATMLTAATTDRDPTVRRRAVEVAATGVVPSEQLDLLPLLDDPDDRVVETTAWAIGELDPPQVVAVTPLCVLVSGHPDALVREAAVAALGAIGEPDGLTTILAATTDIATVRRRAVLALAPFDGPEVDEALERARTDRDWQVRQAAEDLMAPPS